MPYQMLPGKQEDIEAIARRCRAHVKRRALISAGATLVPIPGLDIAADLGLLTGLIAQINREFGLTPAQIEELEPQMRVRLYQATVTFGGAMIGKLVTQDLVVRALRSVGTRLTAKQVARYIPIAGQALSAALGYGALRYVGERHVRDCVRVLEAVMIAGNDGLAIEGVAIRVER